MSMEHRNVSVGKSFGLKGFRHSAKHCLYLANKNVLKNNFDACFVSAFMNGGAHFGREDCMKAEDWFKAENTRSVLPVTYPLVL